MHSPAPLPRIWCAWGSRGGCQVVPIGPIPFVNARCGDMHGNMLGLLQCFTTWFFFFVLNHVILHYGFQPAKEPFFYFSFYAAGGIPVMLKCFRILSPKVCALHRFSRTSSSRSRTTRLKLMPALPCWANWPGMCYAGIAKLECCILHHRPSPPLLSPLQAAPRLVSMWTV